MRVDLTGVEAAEIVGGVDAAAARGPVYLHGYWQSEDFFADQAEAVFSVVQHTAQGLRLPLRSLEIELGYPGKSQHEPIRRQVLIRER